MSDKTSELHAEQLEQTPLARRPLIPTWIFKIAYVVVGLLLFILALRMLSKGAGGIGPTLKEFLSIENEANTLGFGWLFAYIVLSGSPVASIALTFFDSGVIDAVQTFTMITGSRLGASFIVLFIGFLYYLRGRHKGASISMGIIALTVTATTYIPALVLGIWMLNSGMFDAVRLSLPSEIASFVEVMFDPMVKYTVDHLGNWITFILGIATLLLAFNILDRALPQVDSEHNAFGRIGGLVYKPSAMFLLGMAVTSLTLSVSVSISILVPLSARGFIRRENTLPYIMGCNITTFIDTLVAALLLSKAQAFTVVLVEMASITVISIIILLFFYSAYERMVLRLLDLIVEHNAALAIFMVIMIVAPLLLLLV